MLILEYKIAATTLLVVYLDISMLCFVDG